MDFKKSKFYQNIGILGGAIHIYKLGSITMSDVEIKTSEATQDGGFIYADGTSGSISITISNSLVV